MSNPILPVSEFRTQLQKLLKGATREALEAWIMESGELRPARERKAFLEGISTRLKGKAVPKPPQKRDLLSEIDGLLEALARGDYYSEEDWDGYGCADDSDDSWAEEMDELFAEAQALCVNGEPARGVEALRRLLHGLALEAQEGVFGESSGFHLLETDLDAMTLVYLRAVLDLAPPEGRVAAVVEAAEGLYHVPKAFAFQALGKGLVDPTGLSAFLQARGPVLGKRFDAWSTWLPEALLAAGGPSALLDDLRRGGFTNEGAVKVFLEGALARKDWPAVAEVATGAIRASSDRAFCQALLPLGAEALRRTGHPEGAQALAEQRFRTQLDTWSLLAWMSEEGAASWQERLTHLEVDPLRLEAVGSRGARWSFILKPWEDLRQAIRAKRLPWLTYGRDDQDFTLLAAVALDGSMPARSRLRHAWHEVFRPEPRYHLDLPVLWEEPTPVRTCADLLAWKLDHQPLSGDERSALRQELGAIALTWARNVMQTNSRKGYPFAACQIALAMELHTLSGEAEQAKALQSTLALEFPRHRAFHEDLAKALAVR